MSCLKCGKETQNEQVFCAQCLAVMEAYPVKPDARIQLPHRASPSAKKGGRKRRPLSAEEQLSAMRVKQTRLKWAVALLVILLCALVALLVYLWLKPDSLEWGKNYIVDKTLP